MDRTIDDVPQGQQSNHGMSPLTWLVTKQHAWQWHCNYHTHHSILLFPITRYRHRTSSRTPQLTWPPFVIYLSVSATIHSTNLSKLTLLPTVHCTQIEPNWLHYSNRPSNRMVAYQCRVSQLRHVPPTISLAHVTTSSPFTSCARSQSSMTIKSMKLATDDVI